MQAHHFELRRIEIALGVEFLDIARIAGLVAVMREREALLQHVAPLDCKLRLARETGAAGERVLGVGEGREYRAAVGQGGLVALRADRIGLGLQPAGVKQRREQAAAQTPHGQRVVVQRIDHQAAHAGAQADLGQEGRALGLQLVVAGGQQRRGARDVGAALEQL